MLFRFSSSTKNVDIPLLSIEIECADSSELLKSSKFKILSILLPMVLSLLDILLRASLRSSIFLPVEIWIIDYHNSKLKQKMKIKILSYDCLF